MILIAVLAGQGQVLTRPEVHAYTHVLIELESGRILSEHDAHRRMFPAATTMILTAILAYEHLDMDEIIIVGNEINQLPHQAATIQLQVGEAITGLNLIRAMIIGQGLDAANVVAINVARRMSDNPDMPWGDAQLFFGQLMTQRAMSLGAINSRFVNAHGFHHANHSSTAYDLAQIARHAMSIPTIANIASQPNFTGYMAGEGTRRRTFTSANDLLRNFSYARGLRTGNHNLSGEVLVAAAQRDGIMLISVTMNSPIINDAPTRWTDNINLFTYGFENYAIHQILTPATTHGQLNILNPRLGDYEYLEFYSRAEISHFMSMAELGRLETLIEFSEDFTEYYYEELRFTTAIEEGEIIGTLHHVLDGELLFSSNLYATREVLERTTASDIDHYMGIFFSRAALPYWIAGILAVVLLIISYIIIRNRIRTSIARQSKYKIKKL